MRLESTVEWLKQSRQPFELAIEDAQALFLPHRMEITTQRMKGGQRVPGAYDSHGANAADALCNYLVGSVFPPTADWRRYEPYNQSREGDVGERLDSLEEKLNLLDDNSNFYEAAIMSLKDMWVLGNTTFYQEERMPSVKDSLFENDSGFTGLAFEAVQFANIFRHLDRHGNILSLAHRFQLTAQEAGHYFEKRFMFGDMSEQMDFWHVVERQMDGSYKCSWFSGELNWVESKVENFSRYTSHRLERIGNEQYAVGRGHIARPTGAGMNELKRQTLNAVGRSINGPLVVENEAVIRTERGNGGLVVMRENPSFQPFYLQSQIDIPGVNLILQQDREQIDRAFMADILLDPSTQPRSAEESRLRQARLSTRIAGPQQSVKRWLAQIEQTKILHLRELGELPELDGLSRIQPVFTSPFFIQQRQGAIQKVVDFVRLKVELANLAQDPAILDDVDFDRVSSYLRKHADIPSEILKLDEVVKEVRAARADIEGTNIGLEQAAKAMQIFSAPSTAAAPEGTQAVEGAF